MNDDSTTLEEPESLDTAPPAPRRDRRPLDLTCLVVGVVALVLAGLYAFGDIDSADDQVRIVWPIVVIGLGVGLLAGTWRRGGSPEA